MKKIFLFFIAVTFTVFGSQAQPNYAGLWTGYITQESNNALANNYYFSLSLELSGNQVIGFSEIRMWDDAAISATMELSGVVSANNVEIQELKITKQEIYTFAYWCLKLLKMEYSIKDGKEMLMGHWESELCNGPGKIHLERAPAA